MSKIAVVLGFFVVIAVVWNTDRILRSIPNIGRGVDALRSLVECTLMCTVCSEGEDVPSAPVTFAARFRRSTFITASAPLTSEGEPPPPQKGHYEYMSTSPGCSTLRMTQRHERVESLLYLTFSHSSGGSLRGTIWQDGQIVANQCGLFHVCSHTS